MNSQDKLRLRLATPADTPGVHALMGEIFAEYDCVLNVEADDPYLLDPCPYYRKTGGEFWVVVDEENTVRATVALYLHKDAGELKTLYVHPSLRRQGWGERLVKLVMEYARRAGREQMILWSDTRFLDAHRLYRRLGFEQNGERDLRDTNNSREYGFARSLIEER